MFSNNQQISMRQTYRLFLFDFIGISTLVVPSFLSRMCGIYGVWSILLAGILGVGYLIYLGIVIKHMQTDMFSFLQANVSGIFSKIIYGYLLFSCLLTAGFVASMFTNLMQSCLIHEESYILVLILLLLISGYAVTSGIESRARVYEVLFWIILIPLFAMLLFSVKDLEPIYWKPQIEFSISNLFKSSYLVFQSFTSMFFLLLFPKYVKKEHSGFRLVKSVAYAFVSTIGILIVLYLILVGTFGQKALASMEFPAVTLMNMVQFTGGFLKRLDAIMVGIWFFTLLALLNLNVFYGSKMMQKCAEIKGNKRYAAMMILLVFLVSVMIEYTENMYHLFMNFFLYVGTPIYLLLPAVLLFIRRKK